MAPAEVIHDDGILKITRLGGPGGLAVLGEIDSATYDSFAAVLERLSPEEDIVLDLSGVIFCDAAGLGAMVSLTERIAHGRRLVLHAVPAPLCKLLSIVGWESLPNLEIHPRPNEHAGETGVGHDRG